MLRLLNLTFMTSKDFSKFNPPLSIKAADKDSTYKTLCGVTAFWPTVKPTVLSFTLEEK